jgi:putative ABC transport system substrate-binding protein
MDRRALLLAIVVACGCSRSDAPKTTVVEPQTTVPRVAVLVFGSRESTSGSTPLSEVALFRGHLARLGYVEGKTVVVEESYADGDSERLAKLANEIAASKPQVIVAIAAAATDAARQATSTIPIVMAHAGNPVGSGAVASLARPGGNVTGTTSMVPDLGVKQVDLLREMIPGLAKLGVLANPTNAGTAPFLSNVNDAARRFNIRVVVAEVARAEDFEKAFALLRETRPDALLVMMEPLIGMHRERVVEFVAANRLPASYDVGREIARQGGLISYGPVLTTQYPLVADYVDKILRGANPADLPVQQPTEFALVVNLKTAKALGLAIPPSLLARADEVIQ